MYFFAVELGVFFVRSSFLLAGSSFWTKHSETACHSAPENNEMSGYGTVPCLAETQHSSTKIEFNSSDVTILKRQNTYRTNIHF